MTIDEMNARKKELGYSYAKIALLSGVSENTVQNVLEEKTKSPHLKTLNALEAVLKAAENEAGRAQDAFAEPWDLFDPQPAYTDYFGEKNVYGTSAEQPGNEEFEEDIFIDKSGKYTIDDYYALPDEQRVELIDGVFYDMAAPTTIHQLIADKINMKISSFIEANNGRCISITSPLDVQLDKDDKTMVQPDVVVVCDRSKIKRKVVYGAPDLVAEVLSESTRRKDMVTKLSKYCFAGVREYWIVDPDKKEITVYDFKNNLECRHYDQSEPVPVMIFGGECRVDFEKIFESVSFIEDDEDYWLIM